MLLTRVRLERFKKFKVLEKEFVPGINVVKGPLNETGKSTLLDGLIVGLFGNPRSTSKELEKYMTWGQNQRGKTKVDFEANDSRYALEKDFETKALRLISLNTLEEWNTPAAIENKVAELLGTNSPTLFLSTSCIRQNQVNAIKSGEKEIGESLEGIITGGAEGTVAAEIIDKLAKQIAALTRGMDRLAKAPGPITELRQQIKDLEGKLGEVSNEVAQVERQKLELTQITDTLNQLKLELDAAEALLDKNKQRRNIEDNIGRLQKEYDKIDALIEGAESLQEKLSHTESRLQAIEGFSDTGKVLQVKKQIAQLSTKCSSINEDLTKRRQELSDKAEDLKKKRLFELLASKTSLIIGGLVSITGIIGIVINMVSAGIVIVIIGLAFLILAMWARSIVAHLKTQISDLKNRIALMEEALKQINKEEQETLRLVNCTSVPEFTQREGEYTELLKDKAALQNQLVGKLGTQTTDQLKSQRKDIAKSLAIEEEKLTEDLINTKLAPEEYLECESKVKRLSQHKLELERKKMECEAGIKATKFNAEHQSNIEEKLEVANNALSREQRKLQVYKLTLDFISRARNESLQSATDSLQAKIQRNFEIFTDGKYKKVMVGQRALEFRIYSDEKSDWVLPEELSGGAVDEFYLACRLALVRLIYSAARPPLILDDPFTNFDKPRLNRTLEFLKKLSAEYQFIIFTLADTYDSIADRIIELPY